MASKLTYSIYFTPLENADSNMYGDEIDVSDRIKLSGIGNIKRSIDSSDYDIGVFTFSDLELTGQNDNGYFNENDFRSIFISTRDRCKVRVVFNQVEMVRNSQGTVLSETIVNTNTYRGLINDEATRLDIVTEAIRFKVLSRDSVLRTTKVSAGVISDGMSFKESLEAILNVPRITSVLNFSASDINPELDLTVDNGSFFDNKSVKESLDKLLLVSNSVLLINDDGDMVVRSRDPDETRDIVNLYGKNDLHKRENIIDITSYNNGRQRMFTSFVVNERESSNSAFVQSYGLRQKKITFDFLTDNDTIDTVALNLVDEFKTPKIELNVKVPTTITKDIQLLDRVSVNYPLRVKPVEGTFLPVIGITEIGDPLMPLPYTFGAIAIEPRIAFKVIEIEDNPEKFTSILKLRQIGRDIDDGVFDDPESCIVGFAVIGLAKICEGGTECDTFLGTPVVGAAQVGCSQIA
jgi:hypothetical protein